MRKPLLIGKNTFSTKKEALVHYKAILNSYNFGESLSDSDYEEVFGLFQYGAEQEENEDDSIEIALESNSENFQKSDEPNTENVENVDLFVADIKVSKVQFSAKCFEIFFSDGDSFYLSYINIINQHKVNFDRVFNRACRNAIQQDIRNIKKEYFSKYAVNGVVKCQESSLLSKWEELEIDHRQPNTFSVIVDRFKEINKIDSSKIDYVTDELNNIIFKDFELAERFRYYHKEKANLRIVRKEINVSRTGMARLKQTSKDLKIK